MRLGARQQRLGGLLIRLGRLDEAMSAYMRALTIEEKWLAAVPGSAEAAMAVSFISHSDIALILSRQNRLEEALAHFRQTVAIREVPTMPGRMLRWVRPISASRPSWRSWAACLKRRRLRPRRAATPTRSSRGPTRLRDGFGFNLR